jgi:hypothetical protein
LQLSIGRSGTARSRSGSFFGTRVQHFQETSR